MCLPNVLAELRVAMTRPAVERVRELQHSGRPFPAMMVPEADDQRSIPRPRGNGPLRVTEFGPVVGEGFANSKVGHCGAGLQGLVRGRSTDSLRFGRAVLAVDWMVNRDHLGRGDTPDQANGVL